MTRRWVVLAACVGVLALAFPATAGAQQFELVVVPALQTAIGEFPTFLAWDINDRGQIAGQASGGGGIAAARFSESRGVEDLDPNGEYRSTAWAINSKGTVLGFVFGGNFFFEDIFLYGRRGHDFLENGKTDEIAQGFMMGFRGRGALPKNGNVFGSVFMEDGPSRFVPHIYKKRQGWVDLSGVHPRFAEEPTFGAYINDNRYQVFVISGPAREGDDPPTGRQDYFVRSPNGSVHEVVSPGRPSTPGSRPNSRGQMAGLYVAENGRERAYVYTTAGGLVDIHPDGFKESLAGGSNRQGDVFGMLREDDSYADLFVYAEAGGLEIVARRSEFETMAQGRKGTFGSIYPEDMNNSGEIVGCIYMRKGPDFPFLYSPEHGLFNLDEVLQDQAPAVEAEGCGSLINNRSQVMVGIRDGGRTTAGILKFDD